MEFTVQPYTADQEAAWDRFVMQESGNGTFLQTRNFLNYHPAGRFEDASLIVTNEHDAIVAVVPAAVQQRDGKHTFVSHPGSTYGGRSCGRRTIRLRGRLAFCRPLMRM